MPEVIRFRCLNRCPGRREECWLLLSALTGLPFATVCLQHVLYANLSPSSPVSPGLDLMHHCLDAPFYVLFFVTVFQLKVASFLLYISYNFFFWQNRVDIHIILYYWTDVTIFKLLGISNAKPCCVFQILFNVKKMSDCTEWNACDSRLSGMKN